MSLNEIQQVSLDILVDVHKFCHSNNIRYSLAYGTLLGAIRHNGFIPWDDDVDLFMPRPDYDLFCKKYKSENGYISISYPDSLLPFARVCDMNKTIVDDGMTPWTKKDHGIWIDIFPIDGAEDDYNKFLKRFQRASFYRNFLFYYRNSKVSFSMFKSLSLKMKLIPKKIFFKIINPLPSILGLLTKCKYEECQHVTNLSCPDVWGSEYLKKEIFEEYVLIPFEHYEFYVMKKYHEVLSDYYGDYMQMPPIEERVARHEGYNVYWKN